MLQIGVVGAGHLGRIHLKLLSESPAYDLVGFWDTAGMAAQQLAATHHYELFSDYAQLLQAVDVVDIVTPTLSHFEMASRAIEMGKHVFIEKPVTHTVAEAERLIALLEKHGVKAQVGHVERFNPAFLASKPHIENPLFIEAHRLAEFNPRGTDVPVVLDLMIHDIDIALSLVQSELKAVYASGVPVISDTPDIANARLEFENGCVANLTTSRISVKPMRKMRFFQRDAYISIDFLTRNAELIEMKRQVDAHNPFAITFENAGGEKRQLCFEKPDIVPNNAILQELESFADSICHDAPVRVGLRDGKRALEVAYRILDRFNPKVAI